ncbi:MAG: UbiX family flavin prenyltransferase [Gammaproteobacteria bacterium]|nr:UbiX family flavin prenyltransferase [Gammaproteobacteria bacterium]
MRLVIGISGASGVIYGIRLLEILQAEKTIETHLVLTSTAKMNIPIETNWQLKEVEKLADVVHNINHVSASIASGSFKTDGMIVAPCSMKTLSAIVHSYADNLLVRATDVTLKENRKLVVMPREAPLHTGHCRLLYEASQMGVLIMPPMPAFYNKPQTIDELIDSSIGRVLDLFAIDVGLVKRWKGS